SVLHRAAGEVADVLAVQISIQEVSFKDEIPVLVVTLILTVLRAIGHGRDSLKLTVGIVTLKEPGKDSVAMVRLSLDVPVFVKGACNSVGLPVAVGDLAF